MIIKCKCGEQLIVNDEDYNSAQKVRIKKFIRGMLKRRSSSLGCDEDTYANDLKDAFNAGLNRATEIVMNECNINIVERKLIEAIRMEMKQSL